MMCRAPRPTRQGRSWPNRWAWHSLHMGDNSYTCAKSRETLAMGIQAATGGDDEVLMSGVDSKHSSVCWLVGLAASLLCIRSSQETERH